MMLVGVVALGLALAWTVAAMLPRFRGRRRQAHLKALACLLVFALFWATQLSVVIPFLHDSMSPAQTALFVLPLPIMLAGLAGSLACAVWAIWRKAAANRRSILLRSLLGVVVFGAGAAPHAAVILGPMLAGERHGDRQGTLARAGDPAPSFELPTVDGVPFRSADLRGKAVVVTFFATWCGPCLNELPELQTVWDEFRDNPDFEMIVIGREESDESVKAFQQEHGFTFPMAADPDASVYHKFATKSIPRTFLISREGTVLYEWTGHYEEEIPRLKTQLGKELARTPDRDR